MRALILIVGAVVLSCGGCGGNSPRQASIPQTSAATATQFHVPLPRDAKDHGDGETFDVASFAATKAYYERVMPDAPWHGFTYCDADSGPAADGSLWRSWHHNGTSNTITLIMGPGQNGKPPYLLVRADTSDAIDC